MKSQLWVQFASLRIRVHTIFLSGTSDICLKPHTWLILCSSKQDCVSPTLNQHWLNISGWLGALSHQYHVDTAFRSFMNLKYILLVKKHNCTRFQTASHIFVRPHSCVWSLAWHRPQSNLWYIVLLEHRLWYLLILSMKFTNHYTWIGNCTNCPVSALWLLEKGVVCVLSFQVKDESPVLTDITDCVMSIRSFPTFFTCSKPNSELLLDISSWSMSAA